MMVAKMSRAYAQVFAQILALAWPACSAAQRVAPPQSVEQFRIGVEVNMVTVPVTVRGPRRTFLNDLSPDAFRILEDGREQEIVLFTRESAPLHVALVLDTSESVKPEWPDIADATRRFVEQLSPADKMALVTFNTKARLRLNWGQHADKISGVLKGISCKDFTGIWDALWMTKDLFRDIRGRKVIILMTDGLDNTSSVKFDAVLADAIRSETSVYVVSKTETLRSAALNNKNFWTKEFVQADLSLRRLADETGGRVLYLDDSSRIDTVYREVSDELRRQYVLGYFSSNRSGDGKYRRIQVLVDHPEAEVLARLGYVPKNAYPPGKQSNGLAGHGSLDPAGAGLSAAAVLPRGPEAPDNQATIAKPALAPLTNSERNKFGVEVNLVIVPVTVRGPGGGFLKGLPRSAFRVFEDGREQEVVSFEQENVPANIALVLDTSVSVRSSWGAVKNMAMKFAASLQSQDRFSVVTFSDEARLRMDWGTHSGTIGTVLGSLYCNGPPRVWDALWLVGNEVFRGVKGKKAAIILSDGLDNGSFVSYEEVREAAVRSGAAFYVVNTGQITRELMQRQREREGRHQDIPWKPFTDAKRRLEILTQETGGRLLHPDAFGLPGNACAEVLDELRNQYTIAYVSNSANHSGGYRSIKVTVEERDAKAYARPGYFPQSPLPRFTINPEGKTQEAEALVVLRAGTQVFLRLAETLTSRRKPGDIVQMKVYQDVKVGDMVVLEKGALAWATIDSGTHGPGFGGIGGNLAIEVNGAQAITGHSVRLRALSAQHGRDFIPEDPLSLALMPAVQGLHAQVPKGTFVLAYVDSDTPFSAELLRTINTKILTGKPLREGSEAVVHIYGKDYEIGLRPSSYFGGVGSPMFPPKPSIFLDDSVVARIAENHFLTLEIPPGKHTFKTDRNQLELELREGQEIYLRLTTKGVWGTKGYLQVASWEEGEEEIYLLDPLNAKDIQAPRKIEGTQSTFIVREPR